MEGLIMIIIQHEVTGGRFRYPSTNTNRETPDGFIQEQYVPREFVLSANQDPTDVPDYHAVFQENGVDRLKGNFPAQPHDPLNQYDWRDKI
jgi:hypothetical protein